MESSDDPVAHLREYTASIQAEWIDYNGHVRDAYYALVASYAVDGVMDEIGVDAVYRKRTRCTLYSMEMHIHYLREVMASDDLKVNTCILDFDRKRIHVDCRFSCSRVTGAVATAELMLLHVHQGDKPASAAFPENILATLESLKISDAARRQLTHGSRRIELKRR